MNAAMIAARAFLRVPDSLKVTVTVTRVVEGTVDPVTDASTGDATLSGTGWFTVSPASGRTGDGLDGFTAGEQVRTSASILVGLMDSNAPLVPEPGDTVAWPGQTARVVGSRMMAGLLRVSVVS